MKVKLFTLLSFLMMAQWAFSQQKITGTVKDASSLESLIGATVSIPGTTIGSATDVDGYFSLMLPSGTTKIKVSFVGYQEQEVEIDTRTHLDILLVSNNFLEDVVVVGYTTEKKKDIKGAIAVVKIGDALKETNANILSSLQGRVAGVNITTNGAPGQNASINIRGISSILGDIEPLYIVDGVPTKNISNLSPNDIESMQIMKDAASAAIFGARGANGVVVITTKGGKSEKVKVTLDAFYGVKRLRGGLDMMTAEEYGQALWQQKRNDNLPLSDAIYGTGNTPRVPAFIDDAGTIPSGDVNYLKEVYRPASNTSYNLGVSKAADKSNFYFGLNYNKEDGLAKYTSFDRLTFRVNSSFQITDRISIGENLSIGYSKEIREPEGRTIETAIFQHPIIPIKDNNGNWGGPVKNLGDRLSPLGQLYFARENKSMSWRTFGNVYANIELLKGLVFRSSFAVDAINGGSKRFSPRYTMGRFTQPTNTLTQNTTQTINLTATNTLTYDLRIGKHELQALAGYEWINNKTESFFVTRRDFALEGSDYRYLNGGTALADANGNGNEYGLIGSFGKINYSYNDKYLFSVSVRKDGSSRFGPQNRYGVFPAASAAWRISEEDVFTKSIFSNYISDLKLRASWGKNGNDGIPNYAYVTNYASSFDFSNYDLLGTNGLAQVGYYTTRLGNPAVKWEASEQTNIGVDMGLFSNKLYITADYYVKTTDDLLYPALTPGVVGEGSAPYINVGDIRNRGIELMVSYRKTNSKLNYNFDLTFTTIKNRVMSVGVDGNDIRTTTRGRIVKGQPLFAFFGHVADGIFKSQAEVDEHAAQPGKGLGRIRYRDVNGDGVVNADDRTYLGSPLPKFTAGLNSGLSYGNFDMTLFFDAVVGNKIYDEIMPTANTFFFNSNHRKEILNAWTPDNPNSDIPMLTANNANDELRTSSFYLSDGSFLRLKSAVVGYNLPTKVLDNAKISTARVFVQAQNLFEITGFKGFDYEPFGFEGRLTQQLYPHSRAVTIGINLGF